MNMWKQKTHVMRYFDKGSGQSIEDITQIERKASMGFLDKFLEGKSI